MAFGGFSQGDTRPLQSDINMVPLIDVMLVLLIVFMITAPLLTHSVKIDLPQASSNPTQEKPETVSVSIDGEGRVFIFAKRKLLPGEELFYDYSLNLDEKPTKKLLKEYACYCGNKKCRGTMLDID